jgi:hypothetical protein
MQNPKATLLTLEQLLAEIEYDDAELGAVVKAANRIYSLGIAQKLETANLASSFIQDPEMNKFIATTVRNLTGTPLEECTFDEHPDDFIELAQAFSLLVAAVYWKCKGPERLSQTIAHMGGISRQIDHPQA